ncbi:MAG: cadherin-like domain-containing protein, partial [Phycisphaerae bacterium]
MAMLIAAAQSADPLTVDLDGAASYDPDGSIVRYDWDFGDGQQVADGPSVLTHAYAAPGEYTVTLTVTDDASPAATDVASRQVSIGIPALSVDVTSLEFGSTDRDLTLDVRNSGDGTLVYGISFSEPWLAVTPASGTATTETDTITVTVDRNGLSAGNYYATITIDGEVGGSREVAVAMAVVGSQDVTLAEVGDTWSYLKGASAPPEAWNTLGFSDAGWSQGPTGIGYSDDIAYPTILSDMPGSYVTFYARRSFDVSDPSSVSSLRLGMTYDDGFVAYINGTEVARSASMGGTPGAPVAYDSLSESSHDEEEPEEIFDINLSPGLLQSGENVLAIEVHNVSPTSSDACAIPRLEATIADTGDNTAPAANDDQDRTNEDTSVVTVNVLNNDVDADGDALSVVGFTQAGFGTVVDRGDGTFTYTPEPNWHGTDSFTYTVSDGNGGTDTATVTMVVDAVNDADTYYVADPRGADGFAGTADDVDSSDSSPGTMAQPFATLARAAAAAALGDTVLIRGGTYNEQLVPQHSGGPGEYITFQNCGDEVVTITGASLDPAINISNRSYVAIRGLNVANVNRWLWAL